MKRDHIILNEVDSYTDEKLRQLAAKLPNVGRIDRIGQFLIERHRYKSAQPLLVDHYKEITSIYRRQGEIGVLRYCLPYLKKSTIKSIINS